jgi:hypothetical protein
MIAVGIDKHHALVVDVGLAVKIGSFILGNASRGDDDQTVARVSVPTGAASRLP